jgi:hypothetical protein
VTSIWAPTATQKLALEQLTPPSAVSGKFVDGADQVTPPSFEVTIAPLRGPPSFGMTPTATQVVVPLGQLTPSRAVLLVGIGWALHVAPPLLEVMATPLPTATQ